MTVIQVATFFVIAATSVVSNSANTSNQAKVELNWKRHYDVAKRHAQANQRPLVVVLENPTSTNEKIDETKLGGLNRETISKNKFELVRVDVNTDYGKRVAAAFGATKFPYTAVTDDRSIHIVYRKAGQMSDRDWRVALAKSTDGKETITAKKPVLETTASSGLSNEKSPSKIRWENDLDSASAAMKKSGRPMFLYITAPGCTYCEILKNEAFAQDTIANDINERFIPVRVDGKAQKEVSDRFNVKFFPTIAVIHKSGEVIEIWSGYKSLADFNAHLTIAKSRLAERTELH